jgi:hypothetical protein
MIPGDLGSTTPDLRFAIPSDAAGAIVFPALWPQTVPGGAALRFQYWSPDVGAVSGHAASNGLLLTTP